MIDIGVNVSAGCIVSPANWDTIGGLEVSVKKAVEDALAPFGLAISVAVKAVAR